MEDSTKKENSLSEQKIFISLSPEETEALGAVLGESLQQGDVVALNAPLGAGKTVFIRGVVRAFGIEDPVKSPSYTIINEYEAHRRDACFPLYHIDAYRLSGVDDFES
ncbi:MAG: tRNA (adenosine(37)-N6)-threonylcarbamoyltransferase complex ATPase subunit type 1 TsaE, partial [Spirochaetaceae bacterium]|nr:tRNA (adenosine(37)-N6)-threonylcarbamoyltransferase complex ATPase subunit type 1 TsaE [Spirochaetaceae bacterium]